MRQVYQCHGGLGDDTLAAFLVGAGRDHYIVSGGWDNGAASGHWAPVLARPLGEPLADAAYDAGSTVWSRTFASGTRVTFNATAKRGAIAWAA